MKVDSLEAPSQIEEVVKKEGQIDVLVNNAGFMIQGPIEGIANEDLLNQFETNLFGPIRLIQAVLPSMRKRKSGRIINISSIVSHFSFPLLGTYPATKAALDSISESLQKELEDFGIKVSVIEPGYTKTALMNKVQLGTRKIDEEGSKYYNACKEKMDKIAGPMMAALPDNGPALVAEITYKAATDANPVFRYFPNDTDDNTVGAILKDNKHFMPIPAFMKFS